MFRVGCGGKLKARLARLKLSSFQHGTNMAWSHSVVCSAFTVLIAVRTPFMDRDQTVEVHPVPRLAAEGYIVFLLTAVVVIDPVDSAQAVIHFLSPKP